MNTVVKIARSVRHHCQLTLVASLLVAGTAIIGLAFAAVARYVVWPAIRSIYRLGTWVVQGLFGRPEVVIPATSHFAHPVT